MSTPFFCPRFLRFHALTDVSTSLLRHREEPSIPYPHPLTDVFHQIRHYVAPETTRNRTEHSPHTPHPGISLPAIEKVLKHLGLLDVKARPGPKRKAPPLRIQIDFSDSQISSSDSFYADPNYPMDSYMTS